MERKRYSIKARTQRGQWQAKFLQLLAQNGNLTLSSRLCKVDRRTVFNHRQTDVEFAKSVDEALDAAADELEAEAWRRAKDGIEKKVYYEGAVVDKCREYSDSLLMFLLKGLRPRKYREQSKVEHTGEGGGPMQVQILDARSMSDEELAQLQAMYERRGIPIEQPHASDPANPSPN